MEDNTATPSSCDDKEPSNQEHTGQRRSQSRQAKQDRLATAEATRDRKGDKLERKRLSDRRSQRLVRERNKLEFQMMKEKLEAFQASDTNVEIKRLLEENDQLKRNNRKLQDSINAVVGLLSPNGPENRITSEAKEKTTTSNMALSTNKCQDRAAEGDMDRPFIAQQTSDMLRSGPAWDDSVPAPASDAGTSESGGIQLQEVPSYESRGAYAFQQASAFLIPTIKSRSLHLHDFMQDRQHTLDGSQRNANADASAGVVQADASQQHINSYDPWGNLDHEFIALSNFNGRDSDVPAMIPYDPFNSLQIPLELVYKTCVTMITRQHELKEAHSAQWYNIWVIKEIEAHRRLSREEFDASLPEKPCLGALLQPLRCQRDLSKKIAASVLKFFSGAPFAEMIAIYCMIHSLFRLFIDPGPQSMSQLPDFFHPTYAQALMPHPVWVDFLAWPQLRTKLVHTYNDYNFETISKTISRFFSINWNQQRGDILTTSADGEVHVTDAFKAHCWRQENWTFKDGLQRHFPGIIA